jgi:glycine betaine/choline ABC-type transport system substrate-binding protein
MDQSLTQLLFRARQRGVEGLEEQYQAKLEPVLQARLHDGLQVMSVVNLRHTVMGASSMFGGTGRF